MSGVEQAQALRHVAHGRVEARVLVFQLFLALLQQSILLLELGVERLAFRDVLMGRYPAAVRPGPDRNSKGAPIPESAGQVADLSALDAFAHGGDHVISGQAGIQTAGNAKLGDSAQRGARLHLLRRQAVHLGETIIGNDDALLGSRTLRGPGTYSRVPRRSACSALAALPRAAAAARSALPADRQDSPAR